jgi:hypothetical protein
MSNFTNGTSLSSTSPSSSISGSRALLASAATALAIAAAMNVPSECLRIFSSRTFRRRVFEPRLARRGLWASAVRESPKWPLSWLAVAWSIDDTDQDVVDELGLDGACVPACLRAEAGVARQRDVCAHALLASKSHPSSTLRPCCCVTTPPAAVYIGTARLGMRIILATAWFDLGVVLPINMHGSYVEDNGRAVTDLDRFTMSHVPPGSSFLWVHAASCVFKTLVTLALLDRFSAWVMAQQLRARRAAPTSWASQRTVLVTHIPPGADVEATFKQWYGDAAVERVTQVVHTQVLQPLVDEKAALTQALQAARAQLASHPGGERPTRKVPALSPCGDSVDAIDFATELLLECDSRLAAARRAVLAHPPTAAAAARLLRPAAFVTFKSARSASVASQCVHACDAGTWQVSAAVEPGNVLWDNVGRYTSSQALALRITSWAATVVFCGMYLVPAAAIQSLTFASNLAKVLPVFKSFLLDPARQSLVEGVLPSVLLFLLAWLWPLFLRMFTVWQGATTWADVDRGMTAKGLLFNVLVGFISTVLSGAVASGLREFVDNPARTPQLLAVKVPATSRFFMSYVILQGIGASFASVARWWQAVQYGARSRGAVSEDAKWPPFHQPFGRLYPHILLQLQIMVLFSTLAPIMHGVSLLGFFVPAITCAKVKMFYHHEKSYEGYGRMWPLVRVCVIFILVLYQLTMAGMLAIKAGVYPAWVTGVATIPLTLLYSRRMAAKYNPSMLGAVPVEVYAEREKKVKEKRRGSLLHEAEIAQKADGARHIGSTSTLHGDALRAMTRHGQAQGHSGEEVHHGGMHASSSSPDMLAAWPQPVPGTMVHSAQTLHISRSASQPAVAVARRPSAMTASVGAEGGVTRRFSQPTGEVAEDGAKELGSHADPGGAAQPPARDNAAAIHLAELERPYLPYLWPPLADVDASLASDDALSRRFGRVTLDDVVSATASMVGAGADVLGRNARSALRMAPEPLRPVIKGCMRMLFDQVDLHSGLDELDEDDVDGGPDSSPGPSAASLKDLRSLTALKMSISARIDKDASGHFTQHDNALYAGQTRSKSPDVLGRL